MSKFSTFLLSFFSPFLLSLLNYTTTSAQLIQTSFESFADEHEYTLASWTSSGFSVPWVNGFNQSRAYVDDAYAISGSKSLRIFYPANNYGTANTGAQAPLMLTSADQYYMSYWIRFSDNFSYGTTNEGGKLPGLAGGSRCSGCAVCTGSNGFTARLMWRTGGRLVLYLYHLDKASPPCGDDNTLQISGADYYAPKGQWIKITQRVKVNSGTNHDGEVEVWVNDQPALLRTGLQFVSNGDKVNSFYFSTFHGGSSAGWSPTVDSYIWFDDIKISTDVNDIISTLSLKKSIQKSQLDNTNTNNASNGSNLYPIPLKQGGEFILENDKVGALNSIEWIDATGNLIVNEKAENDNISMKTPFLKTGVYFLKLTFIDRVEVKKVVVE